MDSFPGELLTQIIENVPTGLFALELLDAETLDFKLLYVNAFNSKIVGMDLKATIGKTLREAFPTIYEDGALLPNAYLKALQTGRTIPLGDLEYEDEEIEQRVFQLQVVPMTDKRVLLITRDVTQQPLTLKELEIALNRLTEIANLSPVILYVYSLMEKRNLYANKSLVEELGYTEKEVQDMGEQFLLNTLHPDDLQKVIHHHTEVLPNLADGELAKLEYRMMHQQTGKYVWLVSHENVFERTDTGAVNTIIGAANNITQEKENQQQLILAQEELEQFVYSVSHDLRAPIRHIEGFADMLQEDEGERLTDKGRADLEKVIFAAKRMGNMIDELLTYSRNRKLTATFEWVDLDAIVAQVSENQSLANVEQQIKWEISPLGKVWADPGMMTQILENLISNSIKYSRKKQITHIKIWIEQKKRKQCLYVQDQGAGFDMRYADKLFSVFQRLHTQSEFSGHGIGLANVRRLVNQQDGKVWGKGEVDKGATFVVELPIKVEP